MADNQTKLYPRAQLAQGNGDLMQVTNVKFDYVNNAKVQHTLRVQAAGRSLGPRECTLSFDAVVDEDGPERDYLRWLEEGDVVLFRFKLPAGITRTFNGTVSSLSEESTVDDAIKQSVTAVGKVDKRT